MLRKNPRFYMSLVMGFLLCWMLTSKTMMIAAQYYTNVQIVEPFIWCFADGDSVLYASLILMMIMAEFPVLDNSASYLIFRSSRLSWLAGQVITVFAITLGYTLFLLVASVLLSLGSNTIFGNTWSETAQALSFAPASVDASFTVARKAIKLTLPYTSLFYVFSLLFCYSLLLFCIQLCATVFQNRKTGTMIALLVGLSGFVLTPDRFMHWLSLPASAKYISNLLSAWLSPLQHATYSMHSLGYDLLPTLGTSFLLLGGSSTLLIIASFIRLKAYQFTFTGAE